MSKLRRRADGKPETRRLDDLLAEAAQDDVVQRLPGKGRPLDLHGYRHADPETRMANKLLADHDVIPPQLQDRRAAEVLEQQAEEFAEKAVLDLGPRRQFVTELQQRLRRCWPPSVITDDLFVHDDVPAWLTPSLPEHDPDGDWQSTAEQLSASTATCNRRLAIARHQVEEALTKADELTTKLNTQAALSRSLSPGLQMTPVRVQERLGQFDLACPQLESVPENLPERLRCAFRAIQPSWWRRLFSAG